MKHFFLTALIALNTKTFAEAAQHDAFYGKWGTIQQCSNAPIKKGGTVLWEPFEISSSWLRHRELWCSLKWGPIETSNSGSFTAAHAQCGEDTVRSYLLGLKLKDNELTIRWDVFRLNGPLALCPES